MYDYYTSSVFLDHFSKFIAYISIQITRRSALCTNDHISMRCYTLTLSYDVITHKNLRMRSVGVLMTPAGGFVVVVIAAVDIVQQ